MSEKKPASSAASKPAVKPKGKEKEKLKEKTYKKEQVEKWVSSINTLLTDPEGIDAFRKFLLEAETECGELTKQLDFYLKCEKFRIQMQELEDLANDIYETYLEVGCDMEVGTGGSGEKVAERLEEEGFPQKDLFADTQEKVKKKLDEGLYIQFRQHLKDKLKIK